MLSERTYAPPVNLFLGYADEDNEIQERLQEHFSMLKKKKLVNDWGHANILAGTEKLKEVEGHLNTANIILLLISSHFMSSDYCYSVMERAMELHQKGAAVVIPIYLSDIDTAGAPFSQLELILPKGSQPVTRWANQDEVFSQITREIREVIYKMLRWNELPEQIRQMYHPEYDDDIPCPYRGLKPYMENDAPLFFGRETYIHELLYKLSHDSRLLLLLGPIGSGKTSVIQAGVIPLLRTGNTIIPRSFLWEILTFIPNESPVAHLLVLIGIQDTEDIVEGIQRWRQQHSSSERLVIVLEQFEELFKCAQPEEQKQFMAQLVNVLIHDVATIIITMSDTYYYYYHE